MSITKELRKWVKSLYTPNSDQLKSEAYRIADRIDAEHDQMSDFCERLESAATDREDVTLWGVDYTALPIDADGVPIHIDDVMEWPTTGETFEVVGIGDGTLFYIEDGSELADWTGASTKRHHHAPTVEDVLQEFAERYMECADAANWQDIIAEYAAKLRLAGEDA